MSSDYIKRYQCEVSRKFVWWKQRCSIQNDGRRAMTKWNCYLALRKHLDSQVVSVLN